MSFLPLRALLHASSAAIMVHGWISLGGLAIDNWMASQYGGHFQYLTIQGLAITWFTMILGLLSIFFPSIQRLKRIAFMIAMPVEVVVFLIYWTLILLLPHLMLPQTKDIGTSNAPPSSSQALELFRIPLHVDLALHGVPAPVLLIDFMMFEKPYTSRQANYGAPIVALLATSWYAWWVERCASINGVWPYPFLNNPFNVRLAIYIGAGLLALQTFRWINKIRQRML